MSSISSQWSLVDLGADQGAECAAWTVETCTTMQKLSVFRPFQSQAGSMPRPPLSCITNGEDPFSRRAQTYLPNVPSRRPAANDSSLLNFAVYETASEPITRHSTRSHHRDKSRGGSQEREPSNCAPSLDLDHSPNNSVRNVHIPVSVPGPAPPPSDSTEAEDSTRSVASGSRLRPLILPQRVAITEALSKEPRQQPPKSLLLPTELAKREPSGDSPQPETVLYALSRVALETPETVTQEPHRLETGSGMAYTNYTTPTGDVSACSCLPNACCCTGPAATRRTPDTSLDYGNSTRTSLDWEADLIEVYDLVQKLGVAEHLVFIDLDRVGLEKCRDRFS